MSNYENQYSGATPVVDEYGNPIRSDGHGHRTHTGEYGNPTHQTNTGYGTGGLDTTTHQGMRTNATTPAYGGDYRNDQQQNQGLSGMLHRSGSSSSSSSEDDGMGGRRKKKGLTEKIKEKIPGIGHKDDDSSQQSHATSATTPGYHEGQQHEEKKGIMDKIKEKLPGHH